MSRPHELTSKALNALRRQGGVLTSAELQELLGVSQPTVSRALAPLIQAGQVQKVGAARSQRYVLPRHVPGVGCEVLVMHIDAQGRASPFARLVPLEGGAFWVDEVEGEHRRHDGLPWFLDDMRPQGFMGRSFAHAHPELQLAHNPLHWSDDDVLRAMTLYGDDLSGNLIMGEASFQRFLDLHKHASRASSADDYPQLAERAMHETHPGSSAGGEQPKFCTITAGRHVIVKFSPPGDSPTDQRMRDLLVCEHLALHTLAQAGLPAARTQLFQGAGRVFLESERFDRTPLSHEDPHGLGGRIGMVSLQVYNAEYVGPMDNWAATANRLAQLPTPDGGTRLTAADARTLRLLDAYGELIANTDRHYGNISLVLKGDDWALSPTYDMLPMLYAPVGGELVPRDFASRPLQPTAATLGEWDEARRLALAFWQAAAADERVSADFRAIAAENARHVGG
ncbi:MAG: transcriptional regulator [Burkholderiales bacterium GWA2_64_37]|nr:MAG: transcriptional regulator [Burkholderiales bacterium GWA2_64_37]HCE94322.1 type II toxin-antitoxin system HipA family toxinoxin YjjJ [Acidovorax sp.]